MGKRITFRGRGRGCAVALDGAVSMVEPRVKLVKGEVTTGTPSTGFVACGDGTKRPMLVTVSQLAEIMYRVRDAKPTSGTATITTYSVDGSGTPEHDWPLRYSTPEQGAELLEFAEFGYQVGGGGFLNYTGAYTRRGYVTVSNDETPNRPMDEYGSEYFSEANYLVVGADGDGDIYVAYREAVGERTMWTDGYKEAGKPRIGHFQIGSGIFVSGETTGEDPWGYYNPDTFRTGFSYFGASSIHNETPEDAGMEPTIHAPYCHGLNIYPPFPREVEEPFFGAEIILAFDGTVAWVDENGSGDPFDPLNKLYIGVQFSSDVPIEFGLRTDTADFDFNGYNYSDTGALVRLKLSDANYVTAKIYGINEPSEVPFAAAGSVTDFDFEATKWWPYATKAGDPAWDEDTGAPTNGGPGD